MQAHSIYIHIPFCLHRCAYCDFNTYAGVDSQIPAYIDALSREIAVLGMSVGNHIPVHSVFFGGGTPSLLRADQLKRILDIINDYYHLQQDVEISLEANPGTLSIGYLEMLREYGFNRLSLGMQSSRVSELLLLERQHSFINVIQSVCWARQAGFTNLNLDLIYGLPGQTLADWQESLQRATSLQPEHLAIYSLILEDGTLMRRWVDRGLVKSPDTDTAAEMFEWTANYLEGSGYAHYEISNWARFDRENRFLGCRHNMQYWRLGPYLGFGAGAHGFIDGYHTANIASPLSYIKRLLEADLMSYTDQFPRGPATDVLEEVDQQTEMSEVMLMGLRLTEEGVSTQDFKERFGLSIWEVYSLQIDRLINLGLLEIVVDNGERIRLTKRGQLLGNRVFIEFID